MKSLIFVQIGMIGLVVLPLPHVRASAEPPVPLATAQVLSAIPTQISDELTYPARVVPKINTSLLAEIDGVVTEIATPLGSAVKAGDVTLRMAHTDPVFHYAPYSVKSPISGIISGVEVTVGSHLVKGQKMISITDPNQIKISVEVPAHDLPFVSKGMAALFQIPGQEKPISVKFVGISPFVDPSTGTAPAELAFVGKQILGPKVIRPGALGSISAKINQRLGISIPEAAVFYRGTQPYVRIVKEKRAFQVAVTLGKKASGNIEILSGIPPHALFIERASRFLSEGEEIKIASPQK